MWGSTARSLVSIQYWVIRLKRLRRFTKQLRHFTKQLRHFSDPNPSPWGRLRRFNNPIHSSVQQRPENFIHLNSALIMKISWSCLYNTPQSDSYADQDLANHLIWGCHQEFDLPNTPFVVVMQTIFGITSFLGLDIQLKIWLNTLIWGVMQSRRRESRLNNSYVEKQWRKHLCLIN